MKSALFLSAILLSGLVVSGCNPRPQSPQFPPPLPAPQPEAQQPSSEEDCKKGVVKACRFAAGLYHRGIGGPPDGSKAAFYADIGCNLSDYESCIILHHYQPSPELNKHIAMLAEDLSKQEEEKRQNRERDEERERQEDFANKVRQLGLELADLSPPWDAEKLSHYQQAARTYERLAEHELAADYEDSLETSKQRLSKLQRSAEAAQKKFEREQRKREKKRAANEDKRGKIASKMAWIAVSRTLKVPSTARLVSGSWDVAPNGIFLIHMVVDAQNSFGAMLRNRMRIFVDVDRNVVVDGGGDNILVWRYCVRGDCSILENVMANPMDRIN